MSTHWKCFEYPYVFIQIFREDIEVILSKVSQKWDKANRIDPGKMLQRAALFQG